MDRVMVNQTWRCNYGNCPYCWVNQVVRPTALMKAANHPWTEWLEALNRLDPAILDFVGGEPFTFPHFVDMLCKLDNKHRYALTSNLSSYEFMDFLNVADRNRCIHVTGSYHPTGKLSLAEFRTRMLLLLQSGFAASVNIIDHPSIKHHISQASSYLSERGVNVKVSPYEHPPDLLTPNTELLTCNAGLTHYVLNNDGEAYRCLSWFRHPDRDKASLGNIFDGSFKKLDERVTCDLRCEMRYVVDQSNTMVRDLGIAVV